MYNLTKKIIKALRERKYAVAAKLTGLLAPCNLVNSLRDDFTYRTPKQALIDSYVLLQNTEN